MGAARSTTSAWLVPVAVLLATACGNDADADLEATTPTVVPDVTEATGDEEAKLDEVVDALLAGRAAFCEALGPPTPDPDHPELPATSTGPVLDVSQELAKEFAEEGLAFHCPEDSRFDIDVLSFEFGEFEGDEAVWLELCLVDDGERVVVETGEVVGGGLEALHTTDAMLRVDGDWKLAERRVNEQWEGEDVCAVD